MLQLSDPGFWSLPAADRAAAWTHLRQEAPVSFISEPALGSRPSGQGYWALTRHEDVLEASRNSEVFCSGQGVGLSQVPQEVLELNASFLVMDDPRHFALRKVVSGAFTPRRIAQLEADIVAQANTVVDEFVDGGGGDVVQDLARKLPLWTISRMLGIPADLQHELYDAAELQIAASDPESAPTPQERGALAVKAATTLHRLAAELVTARRTTPTQDVWSAVVHSELDGQPLSDQMLGGVFALFATAANDTTRNSTAHGVKAFADNPDQWALLRSDPSLVDRAVEEVVRWATPIIHFRRTAVSDTSLGGERISVGDAVVLYYESANRDESAFDRPFAFDITRENNPHVGFGGGGPHFCLGANLARTQLRALFSRLSERAVQLETGTADYLASNFSHGVKRMPVTVTPST